LALSNERREKCSNITIRAILNATRNVSKPKGAGILAAHLIEYKEDILLDETTIEKFKTSLGGELIQPNDEGYRILVDRLWPRGISKKKAKRVFYNFHK